MSAQLTPAPLAPKLRQMLAVLEGERQALAALDLEAITLANTDKDELCEVIKLHESTQPAMDEECRGLVEAAKQQNETNRRIRNLLAANVAARLAALSGAPGLYQKPQLQRA